MAIRTTTATATVIAEITLMPRASCSGILSLGLSTSVVPLNMVATASYLHVDRLYGILLVVNLTDNHGAFANA